MVVRTLVTRRDRPRRCRQGLASTGSKVICHLDRGARGSVAGYFTRLGPPRQRPRRNTFLLRGRVLAIPRHQVAPPRTRKDETSGDAGITCLPLRACRRLRRFRVRNGSPSSGQPSIVDLGDAVHRMWITMWTACAPGGDECGSRLGYRAFPARLPCGNLLQILCGARGASCPFSRPLWSVEILDGLP